MSSRSAVVGGFILGAFTLILAGTLFFGGTKMFTNKTRVAVFFDEPIAGLDTGSAVTFHGVRVGSVTSVAVEFSTDKMNVRTPVYLEIEANRVVLIGKPFGGTSAEFDGLITAGLRAQLTLQSLVTGQLSVDLDFRPGTPVVLVGSIPDVPEIPTVPSTLGQLRTELANVPLRELAVAVQKGFDSFTRLADHVDAKLEPLADSIGRTADAATHTVQTVDTAVQRLQADASATLHGLDLLVLDGRHQLDLRGQEVSLTLAGADSAIHQAEILLQSVTGLVEPRSAFRDDLASTVRDMAAVASSLRNFSATLERNPNAILMGRGGQ